MIDSQLFLGFPLSEEYQQKLHLVPPEVYQTFIQYFESPYLYKIVHEQIVYLGKFLGSSIKTEVLDTFQIHIYSLLKKLIPDYCYEHYPLILLSLKMPIIPLQPEGNNG